MTTYGDRELSVNASEPIELYRFIRDNGEDTESWFYVNADQNVSWNGDVYSACPGLHRSNIQQSGENTTMTVTIDVPRTACVTDELRGTLAPSPIELSIIRIQRGLADIENATIFNGEVSSSNFHDSVCTITGTSEESAWSDGLTRVYCQRTCPHMLYDGFCGADPAPVTFNVQVTDISDDLLTITIVELDSPTDHLGSDSQFYARGFVTRDGRAVFVAGQASNVLTLRTPLVDGAVNDIFPATAGCNRLQSDCDTVHDNLDRFGGFPLIPVISPWAGLT